MKSAKKTEWQDVLNVEASVARECSKVFPVRWPAYYLDLVQKDAVHDPIARMGRPTRDELQPSTDDIADPVGDHMMRDSPFIVRKHADRVILLVTKQCHFYCRFCFRRDEGVHNKPGPSPEDWKKILDYLRAEKDLREVILSGGDPLTLSNDRLGMIVEALSSVAHLKRLRVHTRAPVHAPERVDQGLVEAFQGRFNPVFVTHFNHPSEFTEQSRIAIEMLQNGSFQVKNQSVLLAGVNDCPMVLQQLVGKLLHWSIEPYYLHHPDRVAGNGLFRLSIARGLALVRPFLNRDPRFPPYVLDLPDGCGKVPVSALKQVSDRQFRFEHWPGKDSLYEDLNERIPPQAWSV